MPVQSTVQPLKDVVDPKKRGLAGDNHHQTPPPKKKAANAKNERASMLCNTPPTCIKDKDSHVEYTRKEFLGEVTHGIATGADDRADLRGVIWLRIDKVGHSLLK